MAEPDAPTPKRVRLDSVNPVYNANAFPPPPLPPHAQPTRPLSHPVSIQASSPPPRPYPTHSHSLPPPSHQSYPPPTQGPYPGPQTSPSDIRSLADPRTIPSPGQRPPNGIPGPLPVTGVSQDSISTYRPPPAPQSSAPESVDVKPPPMEHGSHQGSWSMNPDHRPNGSISNGYSSAISPTHHSDPAYHPPPAPPGQQYGQPVAYQPSPYMGQYSGPGQAQMRRKQVRATQACNNCRSRKQKCDEARPCQFCRENNFDCQYKDVPPPKQDRSMMQLQDSVNNISDVLKDFIGEFSVWRQNVESRLPAGRGLELTSNLASPDAAFAAPPRDQSTSRMPTPLQNRSGPRRIGSMKMESPVVPYSNMSPGAASASTPIKQEAHLVISQQPATPAESVRTDVSRTSNGEPKEKSGLQSDHKTPAHILLTEWQSMAEFTDGIEALHRLKESGHGIADYPMQLEQERGLLRVWGVGEGVDFNDGAQGPGSPESSNESDASSPAPGKEGLWGHPPTDHNSPSTSTPREHPGYEGGLGPDGRPDFRSHVLRQLHLSYMQNFHTFHPFLNPSKLQRMFREFEEQYSPDARTANGASPAAHQLNPGIKRKRSTSAFGEPYSPRGAIERSLRNAIVLLVLALGKVCSHKDGVLPHPQGDKGPHPSGAWGSFNHTSFPNGSFTSDASDDSRPRNIDLLPGMAYFSYATDILGNQQGGHTVGHAQAMILAALYIGQFARVLESWSWINSACRVVVVLIKADYAKLHRDFYFSKKDKEILTPKERYRLNLVMCAYWTCVQLESDILAELSTLPSSNVTQYQNEIMYPAGVYDYLPMNGKETMGEALPENKPKEDSDMMIYSSQIWLRVILNEAHNALYGASGNRSFDPSNIRAVIEHAKTHRGILESWRRVLPPHLAWDDNEPPPTNANIARLRAKYYGALYMILRPHLRIAVHEFKYPPLHQSFNQRGQWSQNNSPVASGDAATPTYRGSQMVNLDHEQRDSIAIACQCIDAAIRSTIAFDRIGAPEDSPYEGYQMTRTARLIVTNIFGTLHAQFGNMLVLAAVYKSKLYPYLPHDTNLTPKTLNALFKRTVHVLREVAPNSPVLKLDLEILEGVWKKLDLPAS
ncbi:hypothetical protein FB567DRAFT_110659 [Paraphoma chrysanthemicola]|uniref:Zn(2)-C6 fungal-type domain-containing protein n=1 Tax=Paraphoma chrysanthemicola TaxID=798071 RepID=A0A8K0R273_9PLEO|nr:hypothetical protein FB567DRAFT_110659 [Paraphoma chrysanthemicola]